jgi:hypothetical protein
VLLGDTEAEHLPGCNLAVRRDALLEIDGFDPRFRVAGDDVDVCWRLTEAGHTLGFHPAALVWHRRRASVRAYWRQQRGYGRAEALLERKWPEKYGVAGHATWGGRLYGHGARGLLRPRRVYHGVWGSGAFQPELDRPDPLVTELAASPEWYLVIAALAATSLLGLSWAPLLAAVVPLAGAVAVLLAHAVAGARRAHTRDALRFALTFGLHVAQPAARLAGRLRAGLVPWRRRGGGFALPVRRHTRLWSEQWRAPDARLHALRGALRSHGERVRSGGPFDRWDLEIAAGALGAARLRTVVEEHGRGQQLVRHRISPRVPRALPFAVAALGMTAAAAAHAAAWLAAAALAATAVGLGVATVAECGIAVAGALRALEAS